MTHPRPLFAPTRTLAIRDGVAFLFPPFRDQLGVIPMPSGYNPRDVDDRPWTAAGGWVGTPSRHAFTSAFDFMLNRPEIGTYQEALQLGAQLQAWAIAVAQDHFGPAVNVGYGRIVEVIHNHRIWTPARGDHAYSGLSAHLEHVHIGLHCAEMADPT